jgi:hypothetical protein
MIMSIKLTDTQFGILSAAAQRADRCVVAPRNLKGGAVQKIAAKLIEGGLVKEIKAKPEAPVWRRDEQIGESFSLKLTAAGARAVAINSPASEAMKEGISEGAAFVAAPNSETVHQPTDEILATGAPSPSAPRSGTKLARVLELLHRDCGATLNELIVATSWLPHTTRAALTGLRKRGYAVTVDRSDKERGSTYRARSDDTSHVEQPASQIGGSTTISTIPGLTNSRRVGKAQPQQSA